jgi:carbon-monoxide dehydrogenase medium subunit
VVAVSLVLISLDLLSSLAGVRGETDGALSVGALTTMAVLAHEKVVQARIGALADAAGRMGSPQVRNRATYGGNLCNARPCADSAPPTLVFDATLTLRSLRGAREVPAGEFITGPGQTVRRPDELLERILFSSQPKFTGSAYQVVTNRKAVEITITSAAARLTLDGVGGPIREARLCLASVAPTPVRAPTAERVLTSQLPSPELFAKAAQAAVSDCRPIDDLRGSASYRRWLVELLVRRALEKAFSRARGAA